MTNKKFHQEPNMIEMKKGISDAGGLFYQYRPCRRTAATIYDIENIRHGVVYAQTPLNMNDPFDSMVGFSAEKIYENTISLMLDGAEMDENVKVIISTFLVRKTFGKLAELISSIKELKRYLDQKRLAMHQTNISFEQFVLQNAKVLYSKIPKKLKSQFLYNAFLAFAILLGSLGEIEISEQSITDLIQMDHLLDELHEKAVKIRDESYLPALRRFLSKLTISCFSSSGWNNQLMWSHYANSYSGICVEYDFNRISDFIGFIYPVQYSTERPTISLQDLGIERFDPNGEDKIVYGDPNVANIFSYLLCKNLCWEYEDEWRIINIGKENTPVFIDLPFVKSITFGLNLDELCKRLLLAVCKEKGIACYELIIDKAKFELDRQPIALDMISYNIDDEVEFINLLSERMKDGSNRFEQNSEVVISALANGNYESNLYKTILEEVIDSLCDAYYLKSSLNRVFDNSEKDLSQQEIPKEIIGTVTSINSFVSIAEGFAESFQNFLVRIKLGGLIKARDYSDIQKKFADITELIEKNKGYSWNAVLLEACSQPDETTEE